MDLLASLPVLDVPRVVFARNPLVVVLCQVQFSPIFSLADLKVVAPFQEAIRALYPLHTARTGMSFEISAEGGQPHPMPQQWTFSDLERKWNVVLSQNFITLESREYEQFEELQQRFKFLLTAFVRQFQPVIATRIGLRYINEIRDSEMSWRDAIRPELLGALADDDLSRFAAQSLQQIVFQIGDDTVAIQHGLLPNGSSVQPREGDQALTGPFYLLDIDVGRSIALPLSLEVDPGDVIDRIVLYKKAEYGFFRWSVTKAFTDNLGVRENA